jgi:hypothetical protein
MLEALALVYVIDFLPCLPMTVLSCTCSAIVDFFAHRLTGEWFEWRESQLTVLRYPCLWGL